MPVFKATTGWAKKRCTNKIFDTCRAISVIEILKNWVFLFVFLCQFLMSQETFGWIFNNSFLKHYLSQKSPHLLSQNTYIRHTWDIFLSLFVITLILIWFCNVISIHCNVILIHCNVILILCFWFEECIIRFSARSLLRH